MNTSNITNYKPKDFAELLGVSVKTLQRWDREGILKANRTPTDRRYYTYDQYLQFKGINSGSVKFTKTGKTASDEIDAISGATFTTRAVTNAVNTGIGFASEKLGIVATETEAE